MKHFAGIVDAVQEEKKKLQKLPRRIKREFRRIGGEREESEEKKAKKDPTSAKKFNKRTKLTKDIGDARGLCAGDEGEGREVFCHCV